MPQNTKFLSCDWGTTAFRLRLVDVAGFSIIAESASKQGIAGVYKEWSSSTNAGEDRTTYYQVIIQEHLNKLRAQVSEPIDGLPLIISGMASSSIGMMELPYKQLPFSLDGSDLATKLLPPGASFPHPVLIISGAASDEDVMRGEETQMVGCDLPADSAAPQLMIHPGTHCKHILAQGGCVTSFRTFMTGEIFSLLSNQSILAASVMKDGGFEAHRPQFEQGVQDGAALPLLHALFRVRTGDLFKQRSKEDGFYYLSGLLIGAELAAFPKDFAGHIILAGEAALVAQYSAALTICGIAQRAEGLSVKDADRITLAGQWKVFNSRQPS